MAESSTRQEPGSSIFDNRWLILFFSVLSMIAVANFQYGWTLFVPPLQKHLKVDQAAIQVTFTVFVLLETRLVPFEGWLVDEMSQSEDSLIRMSFRSLCYLHESR